MRTLGKLPLPVFKLSLKIFPKQDKKPKKKKEKIEIQSKCSVYF